MHAGSADVAAAVEPPARPAEISDAGVAEAPARLSRSAASSSSARRGAHRRPCRRICWERPPGLPKATR